jgi:hypothetical protein
MKKRAWYRGFVAHAGAAREYYGPNASAAAHSTQDSMPLSPPRWTDARRGGSHAPGRRGGGERQGAARVA